MRSLLGGKLRPLEVSVRVEPWLNRAVAFAHAMKLVSVEKGKSVVLTARGIEVAKSIISNKDILLEEHKFLSEVAPKLTDMLMTKIWRMEDLN